MARSIDSVRSQTSASAGRSDYKSVALSAAWGAEGTGNADFGPAWKFLSADPQAINDQDEQGRTILHCCCALPDDAGRAVLLNNLLAAGADPRVEDKYGWSPSESDFVLEAEDKWNAWKHRFTDKDLKFLLERGSCKLTSLRVQQALWFCCNRHNVNARFEVRGGVKDQTPLHLIVQCIPSSLDQSKNQQKQKDKPIQELQPLSQAMAKDRLDKWSAKKALLQMRNQLERKGVPVEEWTNIHELLCLVLDLGANAELLDGDKRKASHYSASESVRALLESDWELGEKTREGSTLTENGDVVSATGIVVEENAIEGGDSGAGLPNIQDDLESVSSHFARLSVDLISRDVEEEGLFKRVERAEKELREWRKVNKLGLSEEVKRWPYEDALKNFYEWAKEGHPARRTRALALELVQPALNHHRPSANKKQREEEEEGTVEEILAEKEEEAEYVLEYEFETI